LFVELLVLAEAMGLLKLGTVSLDGTKIKANASKHKALSWDYANQLEAQFKQEIETLMKLAEAADNTPLPEDMKVPEELKRRQDRLAVIAQAPTVGALGEAGNPVPRQGALRRRKSRV
jgi:hypothetical protein